MSKSYIGWTCTTHATCGRDDASLARHRTTDCSISTDRLLTVVSETTCFSPDEPSPAACDSTCADRARAERAERRCEELNREVGEWRGREQRLSEAYVRLRHILGAWATPTAPRPVQVWELTEHVATQLVLQRDEALRTITALRANLTEANAREDNLEGLLDSLRSGLHAANERERESRRMLERLVDQQRRGPVHTCPTPVIEFTPDGRATHTCPQPLTNPTREEAIAECDRLREDANRLDRVYGRLFRLREELNHVIDEATTR